MQIGIIGGGISGLVAAKTLRQYGAEVLVYERSGEIGGVWSGPQSYGGMTSHTSKEELAFSDFPFDKSAPKFPAAEQIQDYLLRYVAHHNLRGAIRFNTEVIHATPTLTGGWTLTLQTSGGNPTQEQVDFLVVASGSCQQPHWPEYLRRTQFEKQGGRVLHTANLGNPKSLAAQKTVVVGEGPSAMEVAAQLASQACTPLVHLFRPEVIQNATAKAKSRWRKKRTGTTKDPLPEIVSALVKDRGAETTIPTYLSRLKEGKIIPVAGEVIAYTGTGIELRSGKTIEAESVVLGTGYQVTFPFFSSQIQSHFQSISGLVSLYRGMLPPGLTEVALLGLNRGPSVTVTSELGAYWLGELIFGYIPMPGKKIQEALAKSFTQQILDKEDRHHQGTFYGMATEEYLLCLLNDLKANRMNLTSWRKGTRRVVPADLYARLRQQTPHPLYVSPGGSPTLQALPV